jgi:hypothetical protein
MQARARGVRGQQPDAADVRAPAGDDGTGAAGAGSSQSQACARASSRARGRVGVACPSISPFCLRARAVGVAFCCLPLRRPTATVRARIVVVKTQVLEWNVHTARR